MSDNKNAVKIFNRHAAFYEAKYMNVDLYSKMLDQFCEAVKKQGSEILDIACGPGNVSQYLLNKRNDFRVLGADLSENMIELARKNNPQANFVLLDAKDLEKIPQQFDGIVCSFLLPYFDKNETAGMLQFIHNKLKDEGILYLSTIEDDYENSTFQTGSTGDTLFMHYYPESYLRKCFTEIGFEIIGMERIQYRVNEGPETTDIVFNLRKKN